MTALHPEAGTTVAGKRRLVRALNAQIRLLAEPSGDASAETTQVDFVCECPHESCFAVVPMTLAEWGAATSEADHYVAHPEHVERRRRSRRGRRSLRGRALRLARGASLFRSKGRKRSTGTDRTSQIERGETWGCCSL